jgi:hypothetical protein
MHNLERQSTQFQAKVQNSKRKYMIVGESTTHSEKVYGLGQI